MHPASVTTVATSSDWRPAQVVLMAIWVAQAYGHRGASATIHRALDLKQRLNYVWLSFLFTFRLFIMKLKKINVLIM